ncbi:MAG: hypothetical protein FJW80_08265 [Actinobacteria bacterium]|nr:hypothetical protein [Actinomycetota bacterium]
MPSRPGVRAARRAWRPRRPRRRCDETFPTDRRARRPRGPGSAVRADASARARLRGRRSHPRRPARGHRGRWARDCGAEVHADALGRHPGRAAR